MRSRSGARLRDASNAKLAEQAKGGGEGRTRTFEAMRRLIYSQLPLPLGTLPHLNPIAKLGRRCGGNQLVDDAENRKPS